MTYPATPPRSFGRLFYTISIVTLLCAIGVVLYLGEAWSYWQARAYLQAHRQAGEPLLVDASGHWMWPRLKDAHVLSSSGGYPRGIWQAGRTVWLLEQRKTGLRKALPARVFCPFKREFGVFRYFRLRRCMLGGGRAIPLHTRLRQAQIRLDGKPCHWSRGACRFGRSWRRVEVRYNFRVGGVGHTCIYAHPRSRRWLTLKFPPQPLDGGIRFAFGIGDGYAGKIPLRVQLRVHPSAPPRRTSATPRTLLDVTIPHQPQWHRHFLSTQRLPTRQGRIEVRLWTQHAGAKPFCFRVVVLSTPPSKRHTTAHPRRLPRLKRLPQIQLLRPKPPTQKRR